MICLKHISKTYGNRKVLDDVSLTFLDGTISVIKGVSGCGKTTLLHIIAGLMNDFDGEYSINGADYKQNINHIGYVFQQSLLFQHLNVIDNLMLIRPDQQVILEYAQLLHVEHLLEKNVSELSNGERQRISIIRALLSNANVIIMDEPSASLDLKQSEILAQLLLQLKSLHKTMIIATHEHCFDDICDQQIQLEYGVAKVVKKQDDSICKEELCIDKVKKNTIAYDYKYAVNRNKKRGLLSNFMISIIIFLLLSSLAAMLHFPNTYKNYIMQQYPYQMIYLEKDSIDLFLSDEVLNNVNHRIYEPVYLDENEVTVFPYYSYQDSALRIPNAIKYGRFPTDKQQVIVTYSYAKSINKDIKNVIGTTIKIQNQTYQIGAILTNDTKDLEIIENYNSYIDSLQQAMIFMDYDELMKLPHKTLNTSSRMISLDICDKYDVFEALSDNLSLPWMQYVYSHITTITFYAFLLCICLGVLLFIVFLFLTNIIYMELYSRKKEFGFLQIFGVDKKRIHRIVGFEYIRKIMTAMVLGNVIYLIFGLFMIRVFGFMFWLSIIEYLGVLLSIILYILLLEKLPLSILLRKNILELIHEEG